MKYLITVYYLILSIYLNIAYKIYLFPHLDWIHIEEFFAAHQNQQRLSPV